MSPGIAISIYGLMVLFIVLDMSMFGKVVSMLTEGADVARSYLSFASKSSSSVADSSLLRFDSCTIFRIYKSRADVVTFLRSIIKLLFEACLQFTHASSAGFYTASITC
jgi:hypothetical protein